MRQRTTTTAIILLVLATVTVGVRAADVAPEELEAQFKDTVRPFLETYCLGCHGGDLPRGQFFLSQYTSVEKVVESLSIWETVQKRVSSRQMPPKDAESRPSPELRKQFIGWIVALREHEARKNAADAAAPAE